MQYLKNGFNNQINPHNNTEKSSNKSTKISFRPFIKEGCNVSELKYLGMEENF